TRKPDTGSCLPFRVFGVFRGQLSASLGVAASLAVKFPPQSIVHLQACPSVVIRAFPEACLLELRHRLMVARDAAKPLAVDAIDEKFLNEPPNPLGSPQPSLVA